MTAQEMFKKLGFHKMNEWKDIEYCTNNTSISFWNNDKTILIESENGEEFSIDRFNEFSKAINQQCKELEWL